MYLLLFCNCAARLSLNVFGSPQNIQNKNMNVKYWWQCMRGSVKTASQLPTSISKKWPKKWFLSYWISTLGRCFKQRRHSILSNGIDVDVGSAKEHFDQLGVLFEWRDDERGPSCRAQRGVGVGVGRVHENLGCDSILNTSRKTSRKCSRKSNLKRRYLFINYWFLQVSWFFTSGRSYLSYRWSMAHGQNLMDPVP